MELMKAVNLFVLILTIYSAILASGHRDAVVSPLVGFEEYYLETRRSNNPSQKSDKKEYKTRKKICTDITNSVYFFHGYGLDSIHPGTKNIDQTFSDNEEKPDYTQYEISVNSNIVHDFAFTCEAWKSSRGTLPPNSDWSPKQNTIVKYYVSRQHQLDWHKPYGNPNAFGTGYFVFVNNTEGKMIVFALAEKSARKSSDYESPTTDNLAVSKTAGDADKHSICDWRAAMKIRLCSLMMNEEFGVTYLPLSEPPCANQPNVTILGGPIPFTSFSNWAVECPVKKMEVDAHQEYYVFQAKFNDLVGFCPGRRDQDNIVCDIGDCILLSKRRPPVYEDVSRRSYRPDRYSYERSRRFY